jgi:hypothetical protein
MIPSSKSNSQFVSVLTGEATTRRDERNAAIRAAKRNFTAELHIGIPFLGRIVQFSVLPDNNKLPSEFNLSRSWE